MKLLRALSWISVLVNGTSAFVPPTRERAAFKKTTSSVKDQQQTNNNAASVVPNKEETVTTTSSVTSTTTTATSTTVSNYVNSNHGSAALAFASSAVTPAMVVYDYPAFTASHEELEEDEVIGYGTAIVACVVSLALGFSLGYGTL
jgi:hypothetical protein